MVRKRRRSRPRPVDLDRNTGRPPTVEEAQKAVDREDEDDIRHDMRERRRQRLVDEGWAGWEPDREKRAAIINEYLRRCQCGWDHPEDCECGAKHPTRCTCKIPAWASAPPVFHEEISPKTHGIEKTSDKKSGRKRKKHRKREGPMPVIYRRPPKTG